MLNTDALARRFGYSGLLITLFLLAFIGPLFSGRAWDALVVGLLSMATALAAIIAARGSRARQIILLFLAVSFVATHVLMATTGEVTWAMAYFATGTVFFGYVALVLLKRILLQSTNVDGQIIAGSVAVYLLIGIVFAYLFAFVDLYIPGAFSLSGPEADLGADFYYYSMVTLTTLGYGDITPVLPIARGLAAFEALIGPLYLTVLVARLVGMQISPGSAGPDRPE
ncbi:MAG: potassium channel family protein [Gammaproteobacteria bacterium]|jgi:hypothetical protein